MAPNPSTRLLKTTMLPDLTHLSLVEQDVVVLDLTPNPAFNAATSTSDSPSPRFICPVSMREMNGRLRFIYLPCGHALSEQALKELGANVCGHCGKEFAEDDAIPINPKEEEIQRLKDRMAKRKAVRSAEEARKKAEKKAAKAAAKKDKETAALANGETSGKPSEEGLEEDGKDREKKRKQREEDEGPGLTYAPPRATDNIRMKLPDLGTLGDKIKGRIDKQSDAVKAIYSKKIEPEKALSPFFQGTFVR